DPIVLGFRAILYDRGNVPVLGDVVRYNSDFYGAGCRRSRLENRRFLKFSRSRDAGCSQAGCSQKAPTRKFRHFSPLLPARFWLAIIAFTPSADRAIKPTNQRQPFERLDSNDSEVAKNRCDLGAALSGRRRVRAMIGQAGDHIGSPLSGVWIFSQLLNGSIAKPWLARHFS